jgi:hypothetical protein
MQLSSIFVLFPVDLFVWFSSPSIVDVPWIDAACFHWDWHLPLAYLFFPKLSATIWTAFVVNVCFKSVSALYTYCHDHLPPNNFFGSFGIFSYTPLHVHLDKNKLKLTIQSGWLVEQFQYTHRVGPEEALEKVKLLPIRLIAWYCN